MCAILIFPYDYFVRKPCTVSWICHLVNKWHIQVTLHFCIWNHRQTHSFTNCFFFSFTNWHLALRRPECGCAIRFFIRLFHIKNYNVIWICNSSTNWHSAIHCPECVVAKEEEEEECQNMAERVPCSVLTIAECVPYSVYLTFSNSPPQMCAIFPKCVPYSVYLTFSNSLPQMCAIFPKCVPYFPNVCHIPQMCAIFSRTDTAPNECHIQYNWHLVLCCPNHVPYSVYLTFGTYIWHIGTLYQDIWHFAAQNVCHIQYNWHLALRFSECVPYPVYLKFSTSLPRMLCHIQCNITKYQIVWICHVPPPYHGSHILLPYRHNNVLRMSSEER